MRTVVGLLACTVLLVSAAGPAGAVTFRPAGQYALTSIESCEAKFTFDFDFYLRPTDPTSIGDAVKTIHISSSGHIGSSVGYITFNPTTASGGTFTMSVTDVSGGALRASVAGTNNGGTNVTTKSVSFGGRYSFTATNLTVSPTGRPVETFAMVHGALSVNGVPSSIHLVRQEIGGGPPGGNPNNCVQSITATR